MNIEYRDQPSFTRKYPEDRKLKQTRTKKDGVMASCGRWSAHGATKGEALVNLKRLMGLDANPD